MFDTNTSRAKCDADEPIAIVGMACRFPGGAHDLESYWQLLHDSRDGIVEIPENRLDIETYYDERAQAPGKIFVRHGGFLQSQIDAFDAQFFGMSPREAAFLDPQQRLLMEVAFESLENAGIPAANLAGSDTGVFVGGFMVDGMLTQFSPLARKEIGQHTAVSSTLTILSNRLSYILDLHGPSFTVDTACSSSLVAMHQACQAIRHGECGMALVGGVNVILRPETLIAMCKGGFLSRDGRSKSFDARADGYGRGEGAGMIVLKPLRQAQEDGDRIHAVVRGSGTNQDGRTDGITVPNGTAQAQLIRKVCEESACDPASIGYVEAHGTGTAIGDPIEMSALGSVFGSSRAENDPCLVGSVKANIGHLEAAAGVAAVIKTALCLEKAQIPPVANLETTNPAIHFKDWNVEVPRAVESFARQSDAPLRAGVNSFGYGGSNAHVLLEEAPEPTSNDLSETQANILVLSARSADALRALAENSLQQLQTLDTKGFANLCYSHAVRRTHYEHRMAIVGESVDSARDALAAYLSGAEDARVVSGTAGDDSPDPVFVFTGMGPQWWGMGRELMESQPIVRAFAEKVDAAFTKLSGWSVLEEMQRPEEDSRVTETQIAQPANFVVQGGLLKLLQSWGVHPAAVVGHSVGEVSSAYAAGALSFEDAVRISYFRSKLQAETSGIGGMLAIGASAADAEKLLHGYEDKVAIAAFNGPNSVTLSGDETALQDIAAALENDGVFNRFLKVETAYHSPIMDPLLDPLQQALEGIAPAPAAIDLYSTVSGDLAEDDDYGPVYWRGNVRGSVMFAPAISRLLEDGHEVFLEVGPHPVLSGSMRECLLDANVDGTIISTLRRKKPEIENLLRGIAELYVTGAQIDWAQFHATRSQTFVEYPTYPWQRQQHWNEGTAAHRDRLGFEDQRPLLGHRMPAPGHTFSTALGKTAYPYVFDHKVEDSTVLPGAAYVEIGLSLGAHMSDGQPVRIEGLDFSQALLINDVEEPVLRTRYDSETRRYTIHSATDDNSNDWIRHSGGQISYLPFESPGSTKLDDLKQRCSTNISVQDHYEAMHARGLQYGPMFQGINELRLSVDRRDTLAHIVAPEGLQDRGEKLHPALLDACFQALIALIPHTDGAPAYVPVEIKDIRFHHAPGFDFWCHGALHGFDESQMSGDLRLLDQNGTVLIELRGIVARSLGHAGDAQADAAVNALMQRFDLIEQPLETDAAEDLPAFVVMAGPEKLAADICTALGDTGSPVTVVNSGDYDALAHALGHTKTVHIVDARFLGTPKDDPVGQTRVQDCLRLLHAIPQDGNKRRLSLILPHLEACPQAVSLPNAAQLGLARVAANEYADLDLRFLQVDAQKTKASVLLAELLADTDEDDVILGAQSRMVRRLQPVSMAQMDAEAELRAPIGALATDQIEVEVLAALTSPNSDGSSPADIVANVVASDADGVATGAKVLARVYGPLKRYMRLSHAQTLPCPDLPDLSDHARAGLLALSVAHRVLTDTARVQKGQSVLLYPAPNTMLSGFTPIAQALGAQPIELSTKNMTDAEMVSAQYTAGVDVVCLAEGGEMSTQLAGLVTDFGCLVDLSEGARIPVDVARADKTCTTVRLDLEKLQGQANARLGDSLTAVAELVISGALPRDALINPLLTCRKFVADQPDESLRKESLAQSLKPISIQPEGCYLITGGFGGFGFEIAKWLATHGATSLALVGRKGMDTPGADDMIATLAEAGTEAFGVAADISDPDGVAKALAEIDARGVTLRGIFHAAAVLDDKPVYSLSPEQLDRVMLPKAVGAWNLHIATQDRDLDCFVMLSSIASLLGSPGQGAYVAANSVLDALAQLRRSEGLAATAVNLGALSQVGMAARHEGVEKHLARVGVGSLTPQDALAMFDRILTWNPVALSAAKMDWALWGGAYGKWASSSRYRHLMPTADATDTASDQDSFARLTPEERATTVEDTMAGLVCGVLRLDRGQLDNSRSLLNMGVDSLMAMELQAGIEKQLRLKVPTLELMKGVALSALVKNLTEKFDTLCTTDLAPNTDPAPEKPQDPSDVGTLLSDLSSMDDAEVERAIQALKILEENNQ